jgi:hypothetical protein
MCVIYMGLIPAAMASSGPVIVTVLVTLYFILCFGLLGSVQYNNACGDNQCPNKQLGCLLHEVSEAFLVCSIILGTVIPIIFLIWTRCIKSGVRWAYLLFLGLLLANGPVVTYACANLITVEWYICPQNNLKAPAAFLTIAIYVMISAIASFGILSRLREPTAKYNENLGRVLMENSHTIDTGGESEDDIIPS